MAHAFVERNPGPVPQAGIAVPGLPCGELPGHEYPPCATFATQMPLTLKCHSIEGVLGSIFEKCSQPGAPLRNRTVDLLLTMDRRGVVSPQAEHLTCQNTSTDQQPQALGRLSQAQFATQSATQFDLASSNRVLSKPGPRNQVRLKWDAPRPTLTVSALKYCFKSFMPALQEI